MSSLPHQAASARNHLTWVRTRILLDQQLVEAVRSGFSLIAAGFGSFAFFEGLTAGERRASELPKTFSLVITAIGVLVILLAVRHEQKMAAWVDADEFGGDAVPRLPDERRTSILASAAIIIGCVSFVALLRLP